jgi:hypothetical protein
MFQVVLVCCIRLPNNESIYFVNKMRVLKQFFFCQVNIDVYSGNTVSKIGIDLISLNSSSPINFKISGSFCE